MASRDPGLIDVPMPIRTPRLSIRPKQGGDGAITFSAVMETWQDLTQWMQWAENRDSFTAESLEIRTRQVMASFLLRESIELIGLETQTGKAVVWCGFHDIDWQRRQCDTGFWVRKSAQRRGIATETANALGAMPSARSECSALGLRIRTEMKLAAASQRSLASFRKGYEQKPICSPVAEQKTGTATPVSASPGFPT